MDKIPFSFGDFAGFLNRMDKSEPPLWFHIMSGGYFRGQLLFQQNKWVAHGNGGIERYAEQLGLLVQGWHE